MLVWPDSSKGFVSKWVEETELGFGLVFCAILPLLLTSYPSHEAFVSGFFSVAGDQMFRVSAFIETCLMRKRMISHTSFFSSTLY